MPPTPSTMTRAKASNSRVNSRGRRILPSLPARRERFGEFIADAVNGQDVLRVARVRLDLAPQVLDVRIYDAVVALIAHIVDPVHQLGAGELAARLAGQH